MGYRVIIIERMASNPLYTVRPGSSEQLPPYIEENDYFHSIDRMHKRPIGTNRIIQDIAACAATIRFMRVRMLQRADPEKSAL
jgi:hypothetical protein